MGPGLENVGRRYFMAGGINGNRKGWQCPRRPPSPRLVFKQRREGNGAHRGLDGLDGLAETEDTTAAMPLVPYTGGYSTVTDFAKLRG